MELPKTRLFIRASGNSNARFVGQSPGVEARWQVDRHIWTQADYGIFYAGHLAMASEADLSVLSPEH
jgi:hypothetical protein